MSAYGPKQTWATAPHMSAFGGKADMTVWDVRFRGRYSGQSGHDLLQCTCPRPKRTSLCGATIMALGPPRFNRH
jgi:hypothetical protein